MSTATLEAPAANTNGQTEKKRIGLSDDNVYFFATKAECDAAVIAREDGSQAPGFRPYEIKNPKQETVGFVQARSDLEAAGRYAINKGFDAISLTPRGRGPSVPKIDDATLNMLRKLWGMGPAGVAGVKEFAEAQPQYRACFDWPEGTVWPQANVPASAATGQLQEE